MFLLLLGAVGIMQVLAARSHLLRGSREITIAAAVLRDPLRLRDASARSALRTRLVRARSEFASAQRDLFLWTPVLSHLGRLPWAGRQLEAASPAADVSFRTADAAISLVDGLGPVLRVIDDRQATGSRLPRLTEALASQQPRFARAQADMKAAAADLHRLPASMGNTRLDAMLRRLRRNVPRLQEAGAWLALSPTLLGAYRPVHYLFVWQNPAELRATGGFLGASDFLTIDRGHISHRFYGNQLPHQISWPPMPLPEELYTPESNWLFVDANWSPDFPLSAQVERWFYGEDTGRWADGVINFLDTATPDLLRATGPVYVPRYHLHVDAHNVVALANRFINVQFTGPDNSSRADVMRKQFFFAVLKALLARAQHVPLDRLPAVGTAITSMIGRRELQVFDERPPVEAAVRSVGADGHLSPGSGDYLYVVDDNRSYNKLNPYVHESASDAVTIRPDLSIDETLTIRYHVGPSPANLEGGGPNWGLWGTKHDYQDFIRVYVPLGSTLEHMSGIDPWAPQIAYGATQFAGRLLLREGAGRIVVIRYRVPANVFSAGDLRHYHLLVQHQPGADLRALEVAVQGGKGVRIEGGTAVDRTTLPLDRDARLRIDIGGNLHPHPVSLPHLPALPDPYIPFKDLRDPRHPLYQSDVLIAKRSTPSVAGVLAPLEQPMELP